MISPNGLLTAVANYASEYFYPTQSNNKIRWDKDGKFIALHPHFKHVKAIITYAKTLKFDPKTQQVIPHIIEILETSMYAIKHTTINHNENINLKNHTHLSTDFLNTRISENGTNIHKIKFNLKKLTNYIDKKVGSIPPIELDKSSRLDDNNSSINNDNDENINDIELNDNYPNNNLTNQISNAQNQLQQALLTPYEKHRQRARNELEELTQENNKNQILVENKLKWLYRIFMFKKIIVYVVVVTSCTQYNFSSLIPGGTKTTEHTTTTDESHTTTTPIRILHAPIAVY